MTAGGYLASTRNIAGMAFALAGVAGVLVGVIGTGWPAIVGGLYCLGVLVDVARPHRRPPLPAPAPAPEQLSSTADRTNELPAPRPAPSVVASSRAEPFIEGLSNFSVVGRGGFSTVYVARDDKFHRLVAVKVLHDLDERGRRWFDREQALMGQLSDHPNIITPYRSGHTGDGSPFMVMEFVPGGSLEDRLRRQGPLPWPEVVGYGIEVSDALEHAHRAGVLHRDLKPANILLSRRGAKLTDFGIAALRSATSTGSELALTLAHCPPEAFAGGHDGRDERSDVYSLASTLHTLLAGLPPFDLAPGPGGVQPADSTPAYLLRIADREPPRLGPDRAPPALDDLLTAAMAKDPDRRPAGAAAFGDALGRMTKVTGVGRASETPSAKRRTTGTTGSTAPRSSGG